MSENSTDLSVDVNSEKGCINCAVKRKKSLIEAGKVIVLLCGVFGIAFLIVFSIGNHIYHQEAEIDKKIVSMLECDELLEFYEKHGYQSAQEKYVMGCL